MGSAKCWGFGGATGRVWEQSARLHNRQMRHEGLRKNASLGMQLTLVDVGGVSLLAGLGALLLVSRSGGLLAGILLLRSLGGSGRGLGGGLLVGGLGRHFGDVD